MADTAFQTAYREEFIAGFEERQSALRSACTTHAQIKGNSAVFLVADSGSATAVTRGTNGLLPYRADNLTQNTATLAEWHDPVRKTGFNIFASQGDQKRIMQETSMGTINRKIDLDIIAQLDTATIDTGTTATASVSMVAKSLAYLGNSYVPVEEEDNMFAVVTPTFWSYMMEMPEFTKGSYVDVKAFNGSIKKFWRWFGVNWIRSSLLTGLGTATEQCFLFHRDAIGNAIDTRGIQTDVGYNGEHDYSYARTTVYVGSKLLQNTGIVMMKHDGSRSALS